MEEEGLLLDRFDESALSEQEDVQPEIERPSRLAVLWRPHALLTLDAALSFLALLATSMKLDGSFGTSWAVALSPLVLACGLSLLFLLGRFVAHIRGSKLRDHLDSKQRLIFWALTVLAVAFFLGATITSQTTFSLPSIVAVSPLIGWFSACALCLAYVVFTQPGKKERTFGVWGIIVLLLLAATLLSLTLRLDGVATGAWAVAFTPFFLLCCVPLVAPVLSCATLKFFNPLADCTHMWNCQRADAAEAVMFGTAAVLLAVMLLPPLVSVVLLMPKLDGLANQRPYMLALAPLLVQSFALFVAMLVAFVRSVPGLSMSCLRRHH